MLFFSELSIEVKVEHSILYIAPSLGSQFDGNLFGMLGNKNGNDTDDLVARDGTVVIIDSEASELEQAQSIFENFGNTCTCI